MVPGVPTIEFALAATSVVQLLCAATAVVYADEFGRLDSSFVAELGTYVYGADTRIRVDGAAGEVGTEVGVSRDLGLGDKNTFRFDGFWRFIFWSVAF